jgi:hypothetical protein
MAHMNDTTPAPYTFEATVRVRVKANSKMEAAAKLRLMVLSSAVTIRDWDVSDLTEVTYAD